MKITIYLCDECRMSSQSYVYHTGMEDVRSPLQPVGRYKEVCESCFKTLTAKK